MKLFKLQLTSYEDKVELWFEGDDKKGEEDFGKALAEAFKRAFEELENTVEGSKHVKKDYPLFVLALQEDTFIKEMERKGFKKLEPDVVVKGDSYSVLWETPDGKKRLTPLRDRGNLEDYLIGSGIEESEEDPNKLIFEEI